MSEKAIRALTLVAHRGYPESFPENTLLGFQQAVVHGACCIETDVQCTRDGVPVLFHDSTTRRLTGVSGSISGRTLEQLGELSAHDPGRFGGRFEGTPIPTVKAFAGWLARHPAVTAFVEIKRYSLKAFGIDTLMRGVMESLEGVEQRCVIISFDDRCIEHTAACYDIRTGWVLPRWSGRTESRAHELSPDYLFAEDVQVPDGGIVWEGPWRWGVYVINDLARALSFVKRGFALVETDTIGDLLDQYRAGQPVLR